MHVIAPWLWLSSDTFELCLYLKKVELNKYESWFILLNHLIMV